MSPRHPLRSVLGSGCPTAEMGSGTLHVRDIHEPPAYHCPQRQRGACPGLLVKSVSKDLGFLFLFRAHPNSHNEVTLDQLLNYEKIYLQ